MPMGDMDMSGWTYTTLYANYTWLTMPIELQYPTSINYSNNWTTWSLSTLYSYTCMSGWFNSFGMAYGYYYYSNNSYWVQYFTLNVVLGGLYIPLTPRQAIEGYYCPLLTAWAAQPLYKLGDMTLDPWISIDNAKYAQKTGSQVVLNSGASDYKMTAMY